MFVPVFWEKYLRRGHPKKSGRFVLPLLIELAPIKKPFRGNSERLALFSLVISPYSPGKPQLRLSLASRRTLALGDCGFEGWFPGRIRDSVFRRRSMGRFQMVGALAVVIQDWPVQRSFFASPIRAFIWCLLIYVGSAGNVIRFPEKNFKKIKTGFKVTLSKPVFC